MEKILAQQYSTLKNVEKMTRANNLIQLAQLFEEKRIDDEGNKTVKELKALNKSIVEALKGKTGDGLNSNVVKLFKEVTKQSAELRKLSGSEIKGITDKAMGRRQYKTVGDKISGMKESAKDFFTLRGFLDKTGIAQRGGKGLISNALDRREEKQDYIKTRMKLDPTANLHGPEKAMQIFAKQFDEQQKIQKDMAKNEEAISKMKKQGFKDDQIARTEEGKKQKELASALAKIDTRVRPEGYDAKTGLVKPKETADIIPKKEKAQSDKDEDAIENARVQQDQLDTLHKIEENTRKVTGGAGGGEGSEGKGGGILAGIGAGLGALGKGIGGLGKGIGKGIEGILTGIAKGIAAFGNPKVLLGSVALIAVAGSMWIVSEALKNFADIEWEDIAKGFTALIGLGVVAAVAGLAAPLLITGAIAIAAVGASLLPFAAAMAIAGPAMDEFATGMERLSNINGDNLLSVGAGLAAIAAGMVAFGAANAVAGVSNLVTGFLSAVTGQKTPVEQILELGEKGIGIEKAGIGVEKLANGLGAFSKVDPEKIKAIAALPVEKIAAMGAAMNNAGEVYNKSGDNAGAAQKGGGNKSTIVSAPTTNNVSKNTQVVSLPIRNQDNTMNRYLKSRYA